MNKLLLVTAITLAISLATLYHNSGQKEDLVHNNYD